jgi:hypothetical protein
MHRNTIMANTYGLLRQALTSTNLGDCGALSNCQADLGATRCRDERGR